MVGLDLALSNGKSYSEHSANSQSEVVLDERTNTLNFRNVPPEMESIFNAKGHSSSETIEPALTLPGYHGGTVLTRGNYHIFHGEFVELAKTENSRQNPTILVNSTEGGAFIEGFEHIPLAQAIEKYIKSCNLDVERVISNGCSKINPKARISQLIETKAALKKTIKESIKLVERCRVFAGQKQTTANQIERYTQVEKKLIKC
jgi:hypothetical protein